jgi:hypothetical protein
VPLDRYLDHEGHVPIRPRPSPWLDSLVQADLTLEFLPLCLGGDRHATTEDHIDLCHMLIVVQIIYTVLTPTGILRCWHYWWWHLLVIQKGLALLQIMSYGVMHLTPLFCIIRMPEGSLLLLL